MGDFGYFYVGLIFSSYFIYSSNGYRVDLVSDAPVVLGSTVTFMATVTDDNGQKESGIYKFQWIDNAIPAHSQTFVGDFTTSVWNVTYTKDEYSPGEYEVQVQIYAKTWGMMFWPIGSWRLYFQITPTLNGDVGLIQNNKSLVDTYVSSTSPVTHNIRLKAPDTAFLKQNATSIVTYWFVDCIYYGATSDLTFIYNYTNAIDQERHLEALVVASFEKPSPPTTTMAPMTTTTLPPSTTTGSPNGTTTMSTTTPKPTVPPTTAAITTVLPSNNITAIVQPNVQLGSNASVIPILPYVCLNTSIVPLDPKKTYGYFSKKVKIRAPVTNVQFSPDNWLKHGEILNLTVTCNGSNPFHYCFKIYEGEYNTTGNESCIELVKSECRLNLKRYFQNPGRYTVLIIISNDVSKKITPVGVNIYEVKKHAQLSVIVVPVACSAVAITLIIFGAAYYIQSRQRYTIEVADFDFAQTSDFEYMTFRQRLIAALDNAFNRTHDDGYSRIVPSRY